MPGSAHSSDKQRPHDPAYTLLRRMLEATGGSLDSLEAALHAAGKPYTHDGIAAWGRAGRRVPRDPALLIAIVESLAALGPLPAPLALQFLHAAGLPVEHMAAVEHLFAPDDFFIARLALGGADGVTAPSALSEQLPPPTALPHGSRLPPFLPNPLFRGRDMLLRRMARALLDGTDLVLTGIGGIGKTQLASEFLFRYGRFFPGGVFWVSGEQSGELRRELAACGGADGMALHPRFDELSLELQLRLVRAAWAGPAPRLLILDNVEDLAAVEIARPPVGGCRLLVTSQLSLWPARLGLAAIPVAPLERDQSVALLRALLPAATLPRNILIALADAMGDLPLALHLAGVSLAEALLADPAAVELYLASLIAEPTALPVGTITPTHHRGVRQSLDLALTRLDPSEPSDGWARRLLCAAACLAPDQPIARELLLRCVLTEPPANPMGSAPPLPAVPAAVSRGYARLIVLGLLETAAHDRVTLHRLVAWRARLLPELPEARTTTEEQLMAEAHRHDGNPRRQRALLPHLRTLAEAAVASGSPSAGRLLRWLGWTHVLLGHLVEGTETLERALELLRHTYACTGPELREGICCLALAYQFQGNMRAARPFWEEHLAGERIFAADDYAALGLVLNNTGLFFALAGDLERARPLLREALVLRRTVYGWKNHNTARVVRNSAWLALQMGRPGAAVRLARRAIALFSGLPETVAVSIASTYRLIGAALRLQGDFDGAQQAYQQALTIFATVYRAGDEPDTEVLHEVVGSCLYGLARLAFDAGHIGEANRLIGKALRIYRLAEGVSAVEALRASVLAAWLQGLSGHPESAVIQLRALLEQLREKYATTHSDIAEALLALGWIFTASGHLEEADEAFVAARVEQIATGVITHPLMGHIEVALGDAARVRGARHQAAEHYRAALQILQRRAPQHPRTGACREALLAMHSMLC